MKKMKIEQGSGVGRWIVVFVVIFLLGFISLITAVIIGLFIGSSGSEPDGNVALISISGPIVSDSPGNFIGRGTADSADITKLIEKADKNDNIKAILLEINSPGGSAVASWELVRAIEKTNKTVVAWIRESGASGAYWAASASDHIVASPLSITGSIGVLSSYIDFSGTLERYNASYQRLVSGKYKDMGTPFRHLTPEEQELFQKKLDMLKGFFVDSVAENRHLPREKVEELATGEFFLGAEAIKLGLIDELGGKDEAVTWIEKKDNIKAKIAEYKKPVTFGDVLANMLSRSGFDLGRGLGRALLDYKMEKGVELDT